MGVVQFRSLGPVFAGPERWLVEWFRAEGALMPTAMAVITTEPSHVQRIKVQDVPICVLHGLLIDDDEKDRIAVRNELIEGIRGRFPFITGAGMGTNRQNRGKYRERQPGERGPGRPRKPIANTSDV